MVRWQVWCYGLEHMHDDAGVNAGLGWEMAPGWRWTGLGLRSMWFLFSLLMGPFFLFCPIFLFPYFSFALPYWDRTLPFMGVVYDVLRTDEGIWRVTRILTYDITAKNEVSDMSQIWYIQRFTPKLVKRCSVQQNNQDSS